MDPSASSRPVHPWWGRWALGIFVILVIATNIAAFSFANVLPRTPEGLLALSSRNRFLVLALGADVSTVGYWILAPARLALAYAVSHLIGRAYADVALGWFTKYLGATTESIDQLNRSFGTAEIVIIPFFAGSNLVAALTGIHRTPLPKLITLVAVGIYVRLALIRVLAWSFQSQLTAVVEWMQRWSPWIVAASLVGVIVVNARNFRRGRAE
ncbi:MAG: hypothetical protein CSA55_01785 [Ilumatobacter coccineus]|uniref:VTT domain-containing protein n=1 Tax=Ilumatobacter coccineus TaxID=467094 RepID=A0A2G6KDL8_9ACTN|nr:MAG: hypothetical protein CSA55_01785 [Ilumatobacter coccineus]